MCCIQLKNNRARMDPAERRLNPKVKISQEERGKEVAKHLQVVELCYVGGRQRK